LTFAEKLVVAYVAAAGLVTPVIASVELDTAAAVVPTSVTATVLLLLVAVAVKLDSPPPVVTAGDEKVVPVGNVKLTTSAAANCTDGVKVTVQVPVCPALTVAAAGAKLTADRVATVPVAPANVTVPRSAIAITTTMAANLLTRFMGLRPDVPSRPTE
jgi:hypothetical protein